MSDDFSRRLAVEVWGWREEGLIDRAQAEAIVRRYQTGAGGIHHPPPFEAPRRPGLSSPLYATAGVLIGAAAVALVVLAVNHSERAFPMMLAGLVLLGSGLFLHALLPTMRRVDALFVASLPPLAGATLADGLGLAVPVALVVSAALLVWRRQAAFVQALSVVAFTVAAGSALMDATSDSAPELWVAAQFGLALLVLALDRFWVRHNNGTPAGLATVGLGAGLIPWLTDTFPSWQSASVEAAFGAAMLCILSFGLALRHRAIVVAAGTVLGLDAVVFAFDAGGAMLGVPLLVAIGLVLLWQAERVKRWMAPSAL